MVVEEEGEEEEESEKTYKCQKQERRNRTKSRHEKCLEALRLGKSSGKIPYSQSTLRVSIINR